MFNYTRSTNKPAGFIRQNKSTLLALIKITNILIIISLFFIFLGTSDYVVEGRINLILLIGILTFEFFATINNLYRVPRGVSFLFVIKNIATAWFCTTFVVIMVISFSSIVTDNQKNQVLYWLLVTPFVIIIWHLMLRMVLNYTRSIGKNVRRVAIIGATNLGLDLENIIIKQPWMGFSFIGYFDDRTDYDD
jgi:putative colanic acid biosynthesis UDP-glucose lipid carrier transferase